MSRVLVGKRDEVASNERCGRRQQETRDEGGVAMGRERGGIPEADVKPKVKIKVKPKVKIKVNDEVVYGIMLGLM